MHARVVIYKVKPGAADAAIKKAEEGLLPLFRQHKGFHSYEVVKAGQDTVVSLSTWESEGEALEAVKAGKAWVQENIAESITAAETHVGVVSFSHRASR